MAQARGSEIDRIQQENTARELRARSRQQAEMAAGIGEADGDNHQSDERDADGRRLWEFPQPSGKEDAGQEEASRSQGRGTPSQNSNLLDLTG